MYLAAEPRCAAISPHGASRALPECAGGRGSLFIRRQLIRACAQLRTDSEETNRSDISSNAGPSSSPTRLSICDIAAAAVSTASMMWDDACCAMLQPRPRPGAAAMSSLHSCAFHFSHLCFGAQGTVMGGRKTSAMVAKRSQASDVSFAIATVTRNPHRFDRWLEYYRRLGAAHVFLAVEQTPEVVEYCAAHPHFVTVSETSAEPNPYDSIIDRQVLHVDKALAACAERGIAWLFHVDDDELLHFVEPWESIVHKARVPLRPVTARLLCARDISIPPRSPHALRLAWPPLTPAGTGVRAGTCDG